MSVANRSQVYRISRIATCIIVVSAIGTLFWQPPNVAAYSLDILLRAYLMFLGTVMAHEATHGHLGGTKAANHWWGRVALLPCTVPYVNFRKTHHLHHAHTNIPGKDPDLFLKPRNALEIPFRAVALPHYWFFWLRMQGRITRSDVVELVLHYAALIAIYGTILVFVGPQRLVWGMAPAFLLTSLLLWYPFALQTHEGHSTGSAEERSHNYYGKFVYWFSLGLSMHREHHLKPWLSWIELKEYVEKAPSEIRRWVLPVRDIREDGAGQGQLAESPQP